MGVPAVERERADARPVRLRQKFRGIAGSLGKIGAHLCGTRAALFLAHPHIAGLLDSGQFGIVFEHARKLCIGMAVEVEEPLHGVLARRLHALRRPRQNRRRPTRDKRRHRTDREDAAAFWIDAAARRQTGQRAIEPAAFACRGFWQAALEQILAVEMRALAIGRGAGVDDDRFVRLEHPLQIGHRRIKREKVIELERRRLAIEGKGLVAA
jgi:hypothetical protein